MAQPESRQRNVRFGVSKDDNYEVENSWPGEEATAFTSTRDYWQHKCQEPIEAKDDLAVQCKC